MYQKRVLLLYHYYLHHSMVERLALSLKDFGICVDVLCMDNFHFIKYSDINYHRCTRLFLSILSGDRKSFFKKAIRKLFSSRVLKSIIKFYELIDFHAFSLDYMPYMAFCIDNNIPFDITLWGSDIMRASEESLRKKKRGFENCRFIKCTENLHQVIIEKYSTIFDNKVKYVYFGNSDYDVIDCISREDVLTFRSALLHDNEDILVTCGYNGSEGQNHMAIIEAIKCLSPEVRTKTFFLFPMTYGASQEYLSRVRETLDEASVHYSIIDEFVTAKEVAKIRLASEVVVNIQKTDAFSGSLQGHLYCNNVLIIGEWLNYVPLDHANIYYIKTSLSNLQIKLETVLSDLPRYKEHCLGNHEKMASLTSWNTVLPVWVTIYKS